LAAADTGRTDSNATATMQDEGHDEMEFLAALRRSKLELEIARSQFATVVDPALVDHVVFRLGAAEKHFNYLFGLARRLKVNVGGLRWEWYEEE